jgi:hypothetical protein
LAKRGVRKNFHYSENEKLNTQSIFIKSIVDSGKKFERDDNRWGKTDEWFENKAIFKKE